MKIPRRIGLRILSLPDDFCGSFTVLSNGKGEWKIEVNEHERVKFPTDWCEISFDSIDKLSVSANNKLS